MLAVTPLLLHDPVAHWLVVAAAAAVAVGEVVASYLGQARDGVRRPLGSLADLLLLYAHGRGAAMRQDRRRGPYRVLRHPSYAGLLLIFAGFGLTFGSWVSAAAALLIGLAGMLPRIWVEERALAQAFGADYEDYASSTARLLPHVW